MNIFYTFLLPFSIYRIYHALRIKKVHIWMKSRNKSISLVVEDYEEPINDFNPMASLLGKKDNASKKWKKDQKSRENLQLNKSDKENEEPFH